MPGHVFLKGGVGVFSTTDGDFKKGAYKKIVAHSGNVNPMDRSYSIQ